MRDDEFPRQTRSHYAGEIAGPADPLPQPSQGMAMPERSLDELLAPGREMIHPAMPEPLPQPRLSEGQVQAQDIREFWNSLPRGMRFALGQSGGVGGVVGQFMAQRQMKALEIAKFQEQVQQHRAKTAYDIFTNQTLPWSQRKKMLASQQDNPHAMIYSQIGDEKLAADFEHLMPFFERDDIAAFNKDPMGFVKNIGGIAALEARMDDARERYKTTVGEREKQRKMQTLLDKYHTDKSALTDTEVDELDKHFSAQSERGLKLKELAQKIQNVQSEMQQRQIQTNILKTKPSEVYSVRDPAGNIITGVYDPSTGKTSERVGAPLQKVEQIIPTNMLKDRAEIRTSIDQLKATADLFHPDFVGTLDTIKNSLLRTFNVPITGKRKDPKTGEVKTVREEDFRFAYDMLQKVLRKTLMGTAQSAQELSANPLAFPSATDRDADVTVPAFLRGQYRNLVQQLDAQDKVLDERMRQRPMSFAARYQQLKQMAATTDASGRNALGFKSGEDMNTAIAERLAEEMQRGWITP